MEDTHGGISQEKPDQYQGVLILIIMEDTHGAQATL